MVAVFSARMWKCGRLSAGGDGEAAEKNLAIGDCSATRMPRRAAAALWQKCMTYLFPTETMALRWSSACPSWESLRRRHLPLHVLHPLVRDGSSDIQATIRSPSV